MFDLIVSLLERTGYFGLALLMLLEHLFPPIPSELIMPLAGFSAATGKLNLAGVIAAGTLGSITGTAAWYYAARRIGRDRLKAFLRRHGRWLTICPPDVDRARAFFDRHGHAAVFFGRLVPTVRTVISIPAGISDMPRPAFLLWTSLGTAVWTALLAVAGYLLQGQYEVVADYVNPVSNAVFGLGLAWYLYRVATFSRGD